MSDPHAAPGVALQHHAPRDEHRALSPMVSASLEILRQNPSAETMRELLQVQKDWEANEARKDYAAAFVALKRDLPTVIAKDKLVDFTGTNSGKRTTYRHATLAAVMDAITDPLTAHGFSLSWHPSTAEKLVTVTCRLAHSAGHFEECTLSGPPDDQGTKSAPQRIASTITLLQRYTALALLGIATRDMPEPEGEPKQPDPERVDSEKNLIACGWLKKQGRTREEAEAFIGRTVAEWTQADREALKAWVKQPTEQQS